MPHEPRRWLVSIRRWDLYEVEIAAATKDDAEDRALDAYDADVCEQVDGGVDSVFAEEVVK